MNPINPNIDKVQQSFFPLSLKPSSPTSFPLAYSDNIWDMVRASTSMFSITGHIGQYTQHDVNELIAQSITSIIESLDLGCLYMGIAVPSTTPETGAKGFYFALTAGTYANFFTSGDKAITVVQGEIAALVRSGSAWEKQHIMIRPYIDPVSKHWIVDGQDSGIVAEGVDGESAYEVWLDAGNQGTEQDFLNSLKATIGAFKPVDYDSNAPAVIGGTASTVGGVTASAATKDVIVLMPNAASDPTATRMYVTNKVTSQPVSNEPSEPATDATEPTVTYQFVYIGDLGVDLRFGSGQSLNDVDIVNDLTTGGVGDVLSAEQGKVLEQELSQLDQEVDELSDTSHLSNPTEVALAKAQDAMQLKAKLQGIDAEETKATAYGYLTGSNDKNGYLKKDGSTVTFQETNDQVHYKCAKIDVSGYKSLRFLGVSRNVSTVYAFGFLDSSGAIINSTVKNYDFDTSQQSEYELKEYTEAIPEGAMWFGCSVEIANVITESDFYCYLQSGETVGEMIPSVTDDPYYLTPLPATKNSVSVKQGQELDNRITALEHTLGGNYDTFVAFSNLPSSYFVPTSTKPNNRMINSSGIWVNSTINQSKCLIVNPGDKIKITVKGNGYTGYYGFLDAGTSFASTASVTFADGYSSIIGLEVAAGLDKVPIVGNSCIITIPEGCKYFFYTTHFDSTEVAVDRFILREKTYEAIVCNNLYTDDAQRALSAERGLELNERLMAIENQFSGQQDTWIKINTLTDELVELPHDGKFIIDSTGKFNNSSYSSEVLEVSPGDVIKLTKGSANGVVAVLKSSQVFEAGNPAVYSDAEGFTGLITWSSDINQGDYVYMVMPADAAYFYHRTTGSGISYTDKVEILKNVNNPAGIDISVKQLDIDMNGGFIVQGEISEVDMSYDNLTTIAGYFTNPSGMYADPYKAYYVISNNIRYTAEIERTEGYSHIKVTAGTYSTRMFFTKIQMPNEGHTANELASTYYVTGDAKTSVAYVTANQTSYIKIPDNTAYIYISRVRDKDETPQYNRLPTYFAFCNGTEGYDVIGKLNTIIAGGAITEDTYFNSNTPEKNVCESVGNTLRPLEFDLDSSNKEVPQTLQELNVVRKSKQFALIKWTPKHDVPKRGDLGNAPTFSTAANYSEGEHVKYEGQLYQFIVNHSPGPWDANEVISVNKFPAGVQVTGLPYSSVKEMDTYIGYNVSIHTFMTAVNNPYSLLYSENLSGDYSESAWGFTYHGSDNCATYFGTVCSEFSSYVTGLTVEYSTHNYRWLANYALKAVKLYDQSLNNLRIGDIVVSHKPSSGYIYGNAFHCRVIVGITRDANGDVTAVDIAESTGGSVSISYDKNNINLTSPNYPVVFRVLDLYKNNDFEESEYVDIDGGTNPPSGITYNDDICTFKGDKASFAAGDLVVVNYELNGTPPHTWTGIEVYKNNILLTIYTMGQAAQSLSSYLSAHSISVQKPDQTGHALVLGTELEPGMYMARLTDGTYYSDYTYWEVIDTSHVTVTQGDNNMTTVEFSSSNGTPESVKIVTQSGGVSCVRELSETELINGKIVTNFLKLYKQQNETGVDMDMSVSHWVKIQFKGKYGIASSKNVFDENEQ